MKRKGSGAASRSSDVARSTQVTNPMQKRSSNMGQPSVIKVPVPGVPGWIGKPGGSRGR
jgi:hypothetical protein